MCASHHGHAAHGNPQNGVNLFIKPQQDLTTAALSQCSPFKVLAFFNNIYAYMFGPCPPALGSKTVLSSDQGQCASSDLGELAHHKVRCQTNELACKKDASRYNYMAGDRDSTTITAAASRCWQRRTIPVPPWT